MLHSAVSGIKILINKMCIRDSQLSIYYNTTTNTGSKSNHNKVFHEMCIRDRCDTERYSYLSPRRIYRSRRTSEMCIRDSL